MQPKMVARLNYVPVRNEARLISIDYAPYTFPKDIIQPAQLKTNPPLSSGAN